MTVFVFISGILLGALIVWWKMSNTNSRLVEEIWKESKDRREAEQEAEHLERSASRWETLYLNEVAKHKLPPREKNGRWVKRG